MMLSHFLFRRARNNLWCPTWIWLDYELRGISDTMSNEIKFLLNVFLSWRWLSEICIAGVRILIDCSILVLKDFAFFLDVTKKFSVTCFACVIYFFISLKKQFVVKENYFQFIHLLISRLTAFLRFSVGCSHPHYISCIGQNVWKLFLTSGAGFNTNSL